MLQFARFAMMRAAMALFTLLLVSFIVFTLMEMVPGDCAERYLAFKNTQGSQISVADIQAERVRLGLDKPFVQRWTTWLGNVFFKGEFGDSCILRLNINYLLGDKFLISLGICLAALILAYGIAVPVRHREEPGDQQRAALRQLSWAGDAELPAGADDHARLDGVVRRQHDGAVLEGVPRLRLVV
jgi:ABC-type microcin C transport system permease subunit YejB